MEQWKRCRDAGLVIVISQPVGGGQVQAWIKADEVEEMLCRQREVDVEYGPDIDSDSAVFCPKIVTLQEFED